MTSQPWLHLPGQQRTFPCDTSHQWKHRTSLAYGGCVWNKGVITCHPCSFSIGGEQYSHILDQPTHKLSLLSFLPGQWFPCPTQSGCVSSWTVSVSSWKGFVCFQLSIPLWIPFRKRTCRPRPRNTRKNVLSLSFQSLQRIMIDQPRPLRRLA